MSRGLSLKTKAEPCRTLNYSSIASVAYTGIGDRLVYPSRMILVQNYTDVAVWISLDGLNDHFPLLNQGYLVLDISANKTQNSGFYLAEGERLYCRQLNAVPSSGKIYFTSFYGS